MPYTDPVVGAGWSPPGINYDTGALLTYAAASAGTNGADQINSVGRGVKVVVRRLFYSPGQCRIKRDRYDCFDGLSGFDCGG